MKKFFRWLTLGIVSVMTCAALVACTPSSVDGAIEKMRKEGYDARATVVTSALIRGCVGGITATKLEGAEIDSITAYLFDTKQDAENFYNNADLLNQYLDEGRVIQDGKWVYSGSEDAVEDFTD